MTKCKTPGFARHAGLRQNLAVTGSWCPLLPMHLKSPPHGCCHVHVIMHVHSVQAASSLVVTLDLEVLEL